MKQPLLFIAACLLYSCMYAQTVSTQGKEFYITFPKVDIAPESNERWGPQTIQIQVTSKVNTNGNIVNLATGYSQAFTITAGTATTLVVPRIQCMNDTPEVVISKGIIVTTQDTSCVYAMSAQNYTSDATNVLPVSTLGTDYMVSSYYAAYNGGTTTSEFAVMATEDNTVITITPSVITTGGKPAGAAFTIRLDKGQTYQVASRAGDLTGSMISVTNGCKPVAVFSGNDVGYIPSNYGTGDYLCEQLWPVNTLGKRFIVSNVKGRNSSRVKIAAAYNNTAVIINGSAAATINKGQYYEFEINAPLSGSVFRPNGALFFAATDTFGNLYTTGNYSIGGHFYISKWDGTTWTNLLGSGTGALNSVTNLGSMICDNAGNVYTYGSEGIGSVFIGFVAKWNGTAWTRLGSFIPYDFPEAITVDTSGNIYTAINPFNGGSSYIAKWNGVSWAEVGAGASALHANNTIRSITSDDAGNVYATSNFTNTNGNPYVAKWNGTSWTQVGSTSFFANRYVNKVISDAAGNLFAETYLNGSGAIAKWDGVNWTFLTGGIAPSGTLALDRKGNAYAFSSYNVVRWTGTAWIDVGKNARGLGSMGTYSSSINSIAAYDTNNVYAAGDFYMAPAWWNGYCWKEAAKLITPPPVTYDITTSEPVQVIQYANGKYYDETKGLTNPGDPTMILVPPVEQTITDVVFPLPDIGSVVNHYANITVKSADASNTFLDGSNIGARFTPVPSNPVYSIAQADLTAGTHHLSNPGGFTATVYGFGWSQGYGYNLGAGKPGPYFTVAGDCSREKKFRVHAADSVLSYTWNFGDGSPADTSSVLAPEIIHSYTSGGQYTVTLTMVTSSAGNCTAGSTATLSQTVNISPLPQITVEPSGASLCDQQFIKLTAGAVFTDYLWNTGERSPAISIRDFGNYSVTVTDENSCHYTDTITIANNCNCNVDIPAIFTPNGDGFNDLWKINNSTCPARLNVSVYNRWGSLVYHSNDYQNDWNGTYHSGPLPDATYYYVVKLLQPSGRRRQINGNVTILR